MRFLLTLSFCVCARRGELARLYAVVGGVDFTDNIDTTGYKQKTPIGYLPAVAHAEAGLFPNCTFAFGCLQESLAVERYIRSLSPKFTALTPQELAIDDMFAMVKEDLIAIAHHWLRWERGSRDNISIAEWAQSERSSIGCAMQLNAHGSTRMASASSTRDASRAFRMAPRTPGWCIRASTRPMRARLPKHERTRQASAPPWRIVRHGAQPC